MEITPASITQVFKGRGGRFITVDGDVARDLQRIDPKLRLRYSHAGDYFVVYRLHTGPGGEEKEDLVLTAQQCDQRIVKRVQEVSSFYYDLVGDLDRLDAEKRKRSDQQFSEQVGEIGERLAHAIRKDIGATNRAFIKEKPDGTA